MRRRVYFLCWIFLWPSLSVCSEDDPFSPPSTLWLSGGRDSNGGSQWNADLDIAVSDREKILLGHGQTKIPDNDAVFTADTWQLGFATQRLRDLSLDARYSTWGDQQEFYSESVRIALEWKTGDWAFGLTPEHRWHTGYTRPLALLGGLRRQFDFESDGLGWRVAHRPSQHWLLRAGMTTYDYTRNTRNLNSPWAGRVLTAQTLSLSSGLWDDTATVEVQRSWDDTSLRLTRTAADSAVDGARTTLTGVALTLLLSGADTLEIEAGTASYPTGDNSYSRVALGIRW